MREKDRLDEKIRRAVKWQLKELREIREFRAGRGVLVYTMGKVGTQSLFNSINLNTDFTARTAHRLTASALDRLIRHERRNRNRHRRWKRAMQTTRRLALAERPPIVTAVRDPAARAISAFFQNIGRSPRFRGHEGTPSIETLIDWFFTPEPDVLARIHPYHDWDFRWFDDELREFTGIDVYAEPYDVDRGWSILRHDGRDVLVVRLESGSAAWADGLSELLKSDVGAIERRGDRAAKDPAYEEFRRRIIFRDDVATRVYESRYAKHFYTDAEREAFRRHWTTKEDR